MTQYVVVRAESHGYWLDPSAYSAALPEPVSRLPPAARAFANDADHFDFYSTRCVKDLWFVALVVTDDGEVELSFRPNMSKHRVGLTLKYAAATVVRMERNTDPEIGWMGSVLLDELLPSDTGCAHEIRLTGGTVQIDAEDLIAAWG